MLGPRWPQGRLCAFCGGSFLVYREHPQQIFCSRSHAKQACRRLPWISCAGCHERFPQRRSRQVFCSLPCAATVRPRLRSLLLCYDRLAADGRSAC